MLVIIGKIGNCLGKEGKMRQVKLWLVICGIILIVSGCGSPKQDGGSSNTLTGTWVLDLTQYEQEYDDFAYIVDTTNTMLYSLSLYDDSTYVAKFAFTQAGGIYQPTVGLIPDGTTEFYVSEDEYTGNYSLIHDGASISFGETGYFDFKLSEDILVITGQNGGTYLYHRSGTVDKAGRYQMCELNGVSVDQFGIEKIIELREDHLLGVTQRSYASDGSAVNDTETLNIDSTWRLEDDKLLFTFNNGGTRETIEAELNDVGFTLAFESDGIIQEIVYKFLDSGEI